MKFSAAAFVVAGMALAASAASSSDLVRTYRLKIVAPLDSSVHERFLSIQPNGDVGVYPPSSAVTAPAAEPTPARFSVSPSKSQSQHYELHTYPVGIVDHALALNGTAGLWRLRDVANPATAQSGGPGGYTLDWQSFTLVDLGQGLSYAGSKGRWVLLQQGPGSYAAAWYDGTSIVAQTYRLVDIAIIEA